MPSSVRAAGWAVTTALSLVAAALVFGILALFVYVHFFSLWLLVAASSLVPAAYVAGDRTSRAMMHRRVGAIASTTAYLPATDERGKAGPVRVRGRIKSRGTIESLTTPERVVFRRIVFLIHGRHAVHEAGVDFLLVDGKGDPVLILVENARLVVTDPGIKDHALAPDTIEKLASLELADELADCLADYNVDRLHGHPRVAHGFEHILVDGDEVEVLGYLTRAVDQSAERLERDIPMRAALSGSDEMPLLISPCG